MTTLDLLERAHARLTELREKSTPGPWATFLTATGPGTGNIIVAPDDSDTGEVEFLIGRDREGEDDADLIVTLHRTIDAQLKILAHDIDIYKQMVALGQVLESRAAIWRAGDGDLARAILGEDA
ncbi:hypothetical protein M2390_002591 [Mycetocola sp. BIGb0189]|uniref:hypothetical protein n=1 Tax=Mycetocola sp. BIGb0189 TaxID=2940604 RepID=UPI00216998D5|nr:hypothetical protein [Mycetocola sp. BIGb0189]MCS4277385.1 hypothetical protein [Mycetocola sp. BIGb0189]